MWSIPPETGAGRTGLAALLTQPRQALLGFDFDGTLAPIVADPTTSRLAPGALPVLQSLATRVGQIAVVTGRPADVVVELGGLDQVPGLVVWGQYGAQRWAGGVLDTPPAAPGITAVRAALPELLAGDDPAIWVEDKGLGLVVHTRRSSDPEGDFERLKAPLAALAADNDLDLELGRDMLELRRASGDKGDALRRLVAEVSPAVVAFFGDDVGDLPAFAAVEQLRDGDGGIPGLTVAARSDEVPEVADRADVVVDGPAGVVSWLQSVLDALTAADRE